jgi:hypothetical protein
MDARSVEVLQRSAGYLCLRFPAAAGGSGFGATLEAGLNELPGIRQIAWIEREAKLLVRFDPASCSHGMLALRVKALLPTDPPGFSAELPADPATGTSGIGPSGTAGDISATPSLEARWQALRGQAIALAPARFRPVVESATTEKAVTNFVNDIVAFYLIRVHWEQITKLWIKSPAKYGNAWLTVFYLVFLLVRYRKS